MDLEKTFTYIWEDADWLKKIAIAAVLLLTGIGGNCCNRLGSRNCPPCGQ